MFDLCVNLLKESINLVLKSKQIKTDTKLRISILLDEISNILLDTAKKLEKNEYPHFNCSLMEKMSDHLHFYLEDFLPENQLNELTCLLKESSQVEKQFAMREDPKTIKSLIDASAEFKSISLLLKV